MQIYKFKFTKERHYIYLTKKLVQIYITMPYTIKNIISKDDHNTDLLHMIQQASRNNN